MLLCPICNKVSTELYKPFCSSRCKQIDLLHWLNETYKISTNESKNLSNEENK